MRDLAKLPKAHLHLHFTGSMRQQTLVELALRDRIQLPSAFLTDWPPKLTNHDERGWFRFQKLYDLARSVLRTEADIYRLVLEAASDDKAEGSHWLELQVDPSGFAAKFGGITNFTELVLAAAASAASETGIGVSIIIAANRTKHPLEARTLARLAASYANAGVIGFGLSNDERRGQTADFAPAFAIAKRAGLALLPHGGELLGPDSARECLALGANRIGHGVRISEDPKLLAETVANQVAFEVCPTSNLSLGVYQNSAQVPLASLLSAGATVALGADDPLLFGNRLLAQYEFARSELAFSDQQLAALAQMSIHASLAPVEIKSDLSSKISAWMAESPA